MALVLIALGGNLGQREETFERACALLVERVGPLVKRSSWIDTEPLLLPGAAEQPRYLNGVALFESQLRPEEILRATLSTEAELGRVRKERWGPRTIDLDIIAIDSVVLHTEDLVVPHPAMATRLFVLEPMAEVWPEWRHPLTDLNALEMIAKLRYSDEPTMVTP